MNIRSIASACALTAFLAQSGCVTKMLISGQASATRKAGIALDTTADQDVARTALMNGLAGSEGMHVLSPANEDVMFLLLQGWTSYAFGFLQDDIDELEEGSERYEEKRRLARHAYDRGIAYGLELLAKEDDGWKGALKNDATLKAWLDANFDDKSDAQTLFWIAAAWMGRTNLMQDKPEVVAELWIGVRLAEKSFALDSAYYNGSARVLLAAYHARASVAELDEAKRMFDEAIAVSKRLNLTVLVNYATRYACMKHDRALYESLLDEVLKFDDAKAPNLRLGNTLAKRQAKRATRKNALLACGFNAAEPSSAGKAQSNLDAGEVSADDFMAKPTNTPKPPQAPTAMPTTAVPSTYPSAKPNLKGPPAGF
jgi:TRAP transporter T-component